MFQKTLFIGGTWSLSCSPSGPRMQQMFLCGSARPRPWLKSALVSPGPGYVWTPGYHRWDGNRYVWTGGRGFSPRGRMPAGWRIAGFTATAAG